jgi:hypothetical protein
LGLGGTFCFRVACLAVIVSLAEFGEFVSWASLEELVGLTDFELVGSVTVAWIVVVDSLG